MVDCVLYFEGDRHHTFRILRAVKNRFGSTNEIGVFVMEARGLKEVANPSALLLSERSQLAIGSIVTATMEGTRPVLVEIQSLLTDSAYGNPRRMATGLDYNRVAMLMAVLQKRLGLHLGQQDAYVNVVGGMKIDEPAADLAIALAISSSFSNASIQPGLVAIGEVGLTGEVRGVSQLDMRIKEAEKLGFEHCMVPQNNLNSAHSKYAIDVIGVASVQEAVECATGR